MTEILREHRQKTLEHLESYFATGVAEGLYRGHQPVYGFGGPSQCTHQVVFLARVQSILEKLNTLRFETLLDVGGGEGYIANLAQRIFGAYAVSSDLSFQANLRARELFNLDSLALDAARLPFRDEAFDVVVCSEVIEHLEYPVRALRELMRVSRRAVVISTMEWAESPRERQLRLLLRDLDQPHAELCFWHRSDFERILGREGLGCSHILNVREYAEAGYNDERFNFETARALVGRMAAQTAYGTPRAIGLILVKRKDGSPPDPPAIPVEELLHRHFDARLPVDHTSYPVPGRVPEALLSRMRCPLTGGPLTASGGVLRGPGGAEFPVDSGIPRMDFSADLELPPADALETEYRQLFSRENVARGQAERRRVERSLEVLERWRSFRSSGGIAAKAGKVMRLLLGKRG